MASIHSLLSLCPSTDVSLRDHLGNFPVTVACTRGQLWACARLALCSGQDELSQAVLHGARAGQTACVRLLVEALVASDHEDAALRRVLIDAAVGAAREGRDAVLEVLAGFVGAEALFGCPEVARAARESGRASTRWLLADGARLARAGSPFSAFWFAVLPLGAWVVGWCPWWVSVPAILGPTLAFGAPALRVGANKMALRSWEMVGFCHSAYFWTLVLPLVDRRTRSSGLMPALLLFFAAYLALYTVSRRISERRPRARDPSAQREWLEALALAQGGQTPEFGASPMCLLCRTRMAEGTCTKHCHLCGRCTGWFDHHCVFIGGDVGEGNRTPFLFYLLSLWAFMAVWLVMAYRDVVGPSGGLLATQGFFFPAFLFVAAFAWGVGLLILFQAALLTYGTTAEDLLHSLVYPALGNGRPATWPPRRPGLWKSLKVSQS